MVTKHLLTGMILQVGTFLILLALEALYFLLANEMEKMFLIRYNTSQVV